jgi:hypothetical protein
MDGADDSITVPFDSGPLDGMSQSVPRPFAVEGYEVHHPSPRFIEAMREADPPPTPMIVLPDAAWDRYVLRRRGDGWAFEYAGQLGSDAPPVP